tara:strand:- start:131 stop:901 length:771 start_codon:yes stop_codon:yes gene_type:complete
MDRLKNKTAIITGAAAGIGLATTRRFVEEGAFVIMTDINRTAGEAAVREFGERAKFIPHDVTREEDWQKVTATAKETAGAIDILINNAGILAISDHQTIEDTDLNHWRAIQKVNVEGVFLGCQAAIGAMKERGGAIVNVSSIAALIATPTLAAYGASKAAVRQLTKTVALHCAQKGYRIRCNSVHPDPVRTDMGDELMGMYGGDVAKGWDKIGSFVPLKIPSEPVDIANAIVFLASDEARHITGAKIVIDGGATAI